MHDADWPALPYSEWRDTAATLQLWTQVVGKIRLALTPWLNHGWQVTLYVTARGLGTGPMPIGPRYPSNSNSTSSIIAFALAPAAAKSRVFRSSRRRSPNSTPQVLDLLARLGVAAKINEMPSEVADPIRFSEDRVHASYDPAAAHRFWRVLLRVNHVFALFRSGFLGKASPIHLFWGSFDLAVTRFSGKRAPVHPGGVPGLPDDVTREAYSHEVSSAGFWPGSDAYPHPAFYSYAYPEPAGFRDRPVTAGAHFDTTLGEYILAYDTVRSAADPDALLLDFLATTYAAAADFGGWDRASLECALGVPARPRAVA